MMRVLLVSIFAFFVLAFPFNVGAQESLLLIPCLQASGVPQLTLPDDATFPTLKQVFNTRFDANMPLAIAAVSSESQVQRIVRCARAARVPAVARSGGHSFEGFSTLNGSVVMDMRPYMKKITVKDGIAKVQAGANNGEVYFAAWNEGYGFNGGTCPTVGISGLALGGGFGFLSRREGLLIDNIVAIRMVAATGGVIIANATHHSDLFWALRGGGGGNYGIVTEWTIKLSQIPEVVESVNLRFPDNTTVQQWQWFQNNAEAMDPAIAMNFKPSRKPLGFYEITYIPDPSKGPIIPLQEQLQRMNFPAFDQMTGNITQMNFIDAVMANAEGWDVSAPVDLVNLETNTPGKRVSRREKSFYLAKPLSDDAIDRISKLNTKTKDSNYTKGGFQVHAYGGAVAEKSDDETAFPHRKNIIGLIQAIARWNSPEEEALAQNYLQTFQDIITAEQPHRGYVNYLDEHPGRDWREVYYEGNYDRLVEIKRIYDPDNLFRNPQSVGTPRTGATTIPLRKR
jgi:hypothetical protein